MDNKEQLGNTSPSDTATPESSAPTPARPGVIVSSSDIVVPPSDAEVSAAASKLTPARNFFDRRPDFSQPSAAAETGDIIIPGAKAPASSTKKLIIGAALAVAAVVIFTVVWIMMRPTSSKELIAAYSDYRSLVIDGPKAPEEGENSDENTDEDSAADDGEGDDKTEVDEDTEDDEDYGGSSSIIDDDEINDDADDDFDFEVYDDESEEADDTENEEENDELPAEYENWFLFKLDSSNLDYAGRAQYVADLEKSYNDFLRLANRASDKVSHREEIQSIANSYAPKLEIIGLYALSDSITEEITARFIANPDDAPKFILEATPGEFQDEEMENIRTLFAQHFQYDLDLMRKYSSRNCIDDGSLSTSCKIDSLEDDAVSDLVTLQNENYDEIEASTEPIIEEFYTETIRLAELVGVENA